MSKKQLNVRVDEGIFDNLEEFRNKIGISRAAAVSMILKSYLDGQDLLQFLSKNKNIKDELENAVKDLEAKFDK